ncbi:MAG: DUF2971 domain-containing protein [Clostridiales bacterium]|nr:DUF2971 domain-containing protein [Clostridiales bacterium]
MSKIKLYRYTSISKWAIENLVEGILYLNPLTNMNDFYEFAFSCTYDESYGSHVHKLDNRLNDRLCHDNLLNEIGVCCLTEIFNSKAMWGHYGDNFKGMCIEYEFDLEQYPNLHKVIYGDLPYNVHFEKLGLSKYDTLLCNCYNICSYKHYEWEYEREWRFIGKPKTDIDVKSSIRAIYFGSRSDGNKINNLMRKVRDKGRIKYYYCSPKFNSYEFEIRTF